MRTSWLCGGDQVAEWLVGLQAVQARDARLACSGTTTESGSLLTATQRRADALVDSLTSRGRAGAGSPLVHVVISDAVAADHVARVVGQAR